MRILLSIALFLTVVLSAKAEFIRAEVGIDGLTCSMCSYSVEKSMRKLDFIGDMKMDLNNNTLMIQIRPGKKPDWNALADKVTEAGFSVRSIAVVYSGTFEVKEGNTFTLEGDQYTSLSKKEAKYSGETTLVLIGKKFVSRKEFPKYRSQLNAISSPDPNHYYTL